jgi:hypothetical protein
MYPPGLRCLQKSVSEGPSYARKSHVSLESAFQKRLAVLDRQHHVSNMDEIVVVFRLYPGVLDVIYLKRDVGRYIDRLNRR